jgi:hypothetical protein
MPGADNSLKALPSIDGNAEAFASDHDGTSHHPYAKLEWGADNAYNKVDDVVGKRLPVQPSRRVDFAVATVTNGTNASNAIDCRGMDPVGIEVPPTFDGTQILFVVSLDNATYQNLYDVTNTQVIQTVSPSRSYPLWSELAGWSYIKIITSINQTGDTVFRIQLRS